MILAGESDTYLKITLLQAIGFKNSKARCIFLKLNKFGKLYISHAKNMTSGEISVISFISQVCSGNLKKYEENPSIPPKFNRIPTAKFMKRCGMSRSEVFEAVSRLLKNGMIYKKKIKGKAFYFPAKDYSGEYYGMVQEEHMVELTKNEKLVYGYLSACQGVKESCDPEISKIAHFTGKSKQVVSKTITSLVRKDVIKRVVNPRKSSTYFVKRFEKNTIKNIVVGLGESPENVLGKSPENVLGQRGESPENVHHYSNNLLKEDNNIFLNNPASGEREVSFFEKDLKEEKKGEKDDIHSLASVFHPPHISVSKESVQKYRPMSMTYIEEARRKKISESLTSAQKKHLENEGLQVEEFLNIQMSLWDKYKIDILEVKKIEESEKKYLHDFIKKYSDSKDSGIKELVIDAKHFCGRKVTLSDYSRSLLEVLFSKIKKVDNVVLFKIDGVGEHRPW